MSLQSEINYVHAIEREKTINLYEMLRKNLPALKLTEPSQPIMSLMEDYDGKYQMMSFPEIPRIVCDGVAINVAKFAKGKSLPERLVIQGLEKDATEIILDAVSTLWKRKPSAQDIYPETKLYSYEWN